MLKVGVIGAGSMGKNHARVYAELPEVKLIGIADPNQENVNELAKIYNTKPFYNHKDLLGQAPDAVSIVVPTSLHKEVALDTAKAGVNILIEKPIADSPAAAREIIKAAQKYSLKLMVGHIERFNPVIPIIKKEIAGNDVSLIEITRIGPFPPRIKDVGVIVDLATHDIDLIRYLTGSEFLKTYSLTAQNFNYHEDVAILLFEMANGTLARVTVNWLTPFKVREINIATREKFIKASLIDQKVSVYKKFKENDSYLVKEKNVSFVEPLKQELKLFIECIKNNTQPPITGEDGLKSLEIAVGCLNEKDFKMVSCLG